MYIPQNHSSTAPFGQGVLSMRNLARITNYGNKQEAWKLWETLASYAKLDGNGALVYQHMPAEDSSWRKIDKASSKLFASLKAVEQSVQSDSPLACPHCKTLLADSHDQYCPLANTASR
jgi:hypothetical protein